MPNYVLESFKEISKRANKLSFPKKPRNIFTSLAFAYDEMFKIYLANKVEEGSKYYVGQHGNNYFSSIYTNHLPEIKTCDGFFSWGEVRHKKSIPCFNFNILNKKRSRNVGPNLTIMTRPVGTDFSFYSRNF